MTTKIDIQIATPETTFQVFQQIPELDQYLTLDEFKERLGHSSPLLLTASIANEPVGFKVGYPLTSEATEDHQTFYSWLGGVHPHHRNKGVAAALLNFQEAWVRDAGFQHLEVKSMNRFPAMLQLLISRGYWIVGVESFEADFKILFRKALD